MLNKQIPIKQELNDGLILNVNSIFYTIQGEGIYAGHPAIFIRLAGCNLQCPDCDTDYAYGIQTPISHLIQESVLMAANSAGVKPIVVITGGEPFRQNIYSLCIGLLELGFKVQVETNGTLFVDMPFAYIDPKFSVVCSPKAGKVNHKLERHITAYKYVLHADSVDLTDGLPTLALSHSASPRVARPHASFRGRIFVQPIDVQDEVENKRHLKAAINSCLNFGYCLGLQLHKIIGME